MSFKANSAPISQFRSLNFRPKLRFLKPTPSGNFMAQNIPLGIRAQKVTEFLAMCFKLYLFRCCVFVE